MFSAVARSLRPRFARALSYPVTPGGVSGPAFGDLYGLTETQVSLKDAAHRFAQAEIAPLAASSDAENAFPNHLWPQLGEQGFLGPTCPEAHGGLGLGYLEHIIVLEEIARASAGIALSYGAHSNLCVNQIVRNASPEQHAKYLPGLCDGTSIGALAMSEAGAGSDVMSMALRADK
jgi:isovaleryl-CoA dehydrogenase